MRNRHGNRLRTVFLVGVFLTATLSGCEFNPQGEVTVYQPDKAYHGHTLYSVWGNLMPWVKYLALVDMEGNLVWSYQDNSLFINSKLDPYPLMDSEVMPNGHILADSMSIREIDPATNAVAWLYDAVRVHHDVDLLPNGKILSLYQDVIAVPGDEFSPRATDGIRIMDPATNETLWDWRSEDHVPFSDYCPLCITETFLSNGLDWLHANTLIHREEPEGEAVYINFRNLNRFCRIDMASGDFSWCLGDGGDFGQGLFSHAHDPEFLPNGNLLLFDNGLHRDGSTEDGYSRAIEIAFDPLAGQAEIVWEYGGEEPFYSDIMGDADRLPNGNILITDAANGRIVEVTPAKEIVWEYQLNPNHQIYKAERIPEMPVAR